MDILNMKIEISFGEYKDTVTTMLAELTCEALKHNDHEVAEAIQEYGLVFAGIIGNTLFKEKLTKLEKLEI